MKNSILSAEDKFKIIDEIDTVMQNLEFTMSNEFKGNISDQLTFTKNHLSILKSFICECDHTWYKSGKNKRTCSNCLKVETI